MVAMSDDDWLAERWQRPTDAPSEQFVAAMIELVRSELAGESPAM